MLRRRRVSRVCIVLGASLLATSPGRAQSVQPMLVEYDGNVVRGSFELRNETLFPMAIVLDARGFEVSETGELRDVPLDTAKIHLRMSAMSVRLPPRQRYTVQYEARAATTPAWFHIISTVTGARTTEGLNLRIELPHVVYLRSKRALRRDEIVVRGFSWDSVSRRAAIVLENTGPSFGRVLAEARREDGRRTDVGGFPLFPGSRRRFEFAWPEARPPERLLLRFPGFTLQEPLWDGGG